MFKASHRWLAPLFLTLCFSASPAHAAPDEYVVSGNLDMTSTASQLAVPCAGKSSVGMRYNRTSQTGTLIMEGTVDGINYLAVMPVSSDVSTGSPGYLATTSGIGVISITNNYNSIASCAGLRTIRVRVGGAGTGSLPVVIFSGNAPAPVMGMFPGTSSSSLGKAEDNPSATGDALVATAITRNDALAVTADTDGDYQVQKGDTVGRTITTLAPAGESFQACTGSITNTTQTDIKTAVASNRIYVTSIGCNNTATVASTLVFGDGASTIWQGAIGNSTLNGVAGYTMTFPVPLRTTANTAFTVTLGTTSTATRCCAAGYISVN